MNWKRSTGVIISIMLLLPFEQLVHACADIDMYDTYPSFFQNNITKDAVYNPFRYIAEDFFYADDEDRGEAIPDPNIQEWHDYAGGKAEKADIDSFVYKYPYAYLNDLYAHIEQRKPFTRDEGKQPNSFTRWFENSRDLEALGYLMYAKKCEPFAQAEDGYYEQGSYEWKVVKRDTAKMRRLAKDGQQLIAAAKTGFIRQRFIYQVLRMYFYAYRYEETIALYDQLAGSATDTSVIYSRCLSIKAGCLYKLGRKAEAAYLFSKVFDRSDETKQGTYLSFIWATKGDIDPVLQFCKTPHEKAVLYVMSALHDFDRGYARYLPLMEKAYGLDPAVKGLDVVATRSINMAEENYQRLVFDIWNNGYYYREETDTTNRNNEYLGHLHKLGRFSEKLAGEGRNATKAFWYLAASYISYMTGEQEKSKTLMDKAAAAGMSSRERETHDIVAALLIVGKERNVNEKTEAELLPFVKQLEEKGEKDGRYRKVYRNIMVAILAPAYLKQGDTIKAVYAYGRSNLADGNTVYVSRDFEDIPGALLQHMSLSKLKEIQSWYQQKNKTAFTAWLTGRSYYTTEVLKELEGTRYIRLHQWDKAVAALSEVPKAVLERQVKSYDETYFDGILPDPFVSHIRDMQDWEQDDSLTTYTTLSFARKMQELQRKLETSRDPQAAFLYATGLYSMSYYGKAHHAYDYYRSSTDGKAYINSPQHAKMNEAERDYYGVYSAEKYYREAFDRSTDPKFKARCVFMAAKCWQKRSPENEDKSYQDGYDKAYYQNSLKNPYFDMLRDKYSNTAFYNEVYGTCSYFKDFIGPSK